MLHESFIHLLSASLCFDQRQQTLPSCERPPRLSKWARKIYSPISQSDFLFAVCEARDR